MSHSPQDEPFSEASLNSPEYRERLIRKLNCLIAVLEVATAKVRKSLASSSGDTERLVRIRTNLQSTLDVCMRARAALERREALPKELPENLTQVIQETTGMQVRDDARSAADAAKKAGKQNRSEAKRKQFEHLGPIQPSMIESCDLEDLTRKLQF